VAAFPNHTSFADTDGTWHSAMEHRLVLISRCHHLPLSPAGPAGHFLSGTHYLKLSVHTPEAAPRP
jgi:hypothetical protein